MNSCYPSLSPKTFRSDSVTVDFLSYFSSIKSSYLEPVKRKERKEARSRKKKKKKTSVRK